MSHYSPLKQLFRRQKALAGVRQLMGDHEWQHRSANVVVNCRPEYFIPPPVYCSADEREFMNIVAKLYDATDLTAETK